MSPDLEVPAAPYGGWTRSSGHIPGPAGGAGGRDDGPGHHERCGPAAIRLDVSGDAVTIQWPSGERDTVVVPAP